MQQGQVAEDVGFDFGRFGFGIYLLQLSDDLLNSMLAIAALHNFKARTVQAQLRRLIMSKNKWHLFIAYLVGSFFGLMQVWALVTGLVKPKSAAA